MELPSTTSDCGAAQAERTRALAAIVAVAALNIAGILPNWTTIAAILTLPPLAAGSAQRCGAAR